MEELSLSENIEKGQIKTDVLNWDGK
jgi:hypothetical protein